MKSLIILAVLCLTCVVESGSPPRWAVSKLALKSSNQDVYQKHYEKHMAEPSIELRNPTFQAYRTTVSDPMELYSIKAKRIVVVRQKKGTQIWDQEEELSIISSKRSNKRKQNRFKDSFVTETVSYGRLKIKSQFNNRYICVKSDGEIIFKDSAENTRKRRPRKRCLFNVRFTNKMHIMLSVETAKKSAWFLTFRDNEIFMTREGDEKTQQEERSFMWLPKNEPEQKVRYKGRVRNMPETDDDNEEEEIEIEECKAENDKIDRQAVKINKLKEKVEELKKNVTLLQFNEKFFRMQVNLTSIK